MRLATNLMFAGVALTVVSLVVFFLRTEQLADAIAEENPWRTRDSVDLEVGRERGREVMRAVFGVCLWVWMAVKNGEGRKWARIVGTIFGVIYLLGAALLTAAFLGADDARIDYAGPAMIVTAVGVGLAITILVLMYKPESSRFYEDSTRWKAAMTLRGY
jgi:hypothetical protein